MKDKKLSCAECSICPVCQSAITKEQVESAEWFSIRLWHKDCLRKCQVQCTCIDN